MDDKLLLKNRLKEIRYEKGLSGCSCRNGRCIPEHDQFH